MKERRDKGVFFCLWRKLTAVVKSHREHLRFMMCARCPTFENEPFTKKRSEFNLQLELINDNLRNNFIYIYIYISFI